MKKFFPRILIWNVTVYSKRDGFPLCNYYFLVDISYGGEMLYLTAFDE